MRGLPDGGFSLHSEAEVNSRLAGAGLTCLVETGLGLFNRDNSNNVRLYSFKFSPQQET